MNTILAGETLMQSEELQTREDGKSWAGYAESFVQRFTGTEQTAPTPAAALARSGDLQAGPAPVGGVLHWWDDGKAGHVGVDLGEGNIVMASRAVRLTWGDGSGECTLAEYAEARPALHYLGWTYDLMGDLVPDVEKYLADEQAAAKAKEAEQAADHQAAADAASAARQAEMDAAVAAVEVAPESAPEPEYAYVNLGGLNIKVTVLAGALVGVAVQP